MIVKFYFLQHVLRFIYESFVFLVVVNFLSYRLFLLYIFLTTFSSLYFLFFYKEEAAQKIHFRDTLSYFIKEYMREDEEVEVVIGAYTIGGLEKGGGRKN